MQEQKPEEIDVDARFLLANERTLLAWIRTSLAVEAGGIALFSIHRNHSYMGLSVLLFGAVIALVGYHRFRAADKAIRAHTLPPEGFGPAFQVGLIVIIAVGLSIAQFTILR